MNTTRIFLLLSALFGFLFIPNEAVVAQQCEAGLRVAELNPENYTLSKKLFETAIRSGDTKLCSDFLATGQIYVNDTDGSGNSPLFVAACAGSVPLCKLLLENGANPDQLNFNENRPINPLEAAIINDRTEAALCLIEALKPETLKPEKGRNRPAVFYAILNENVEILKALIQKGADVNAPEKIDKLTQTPLYFAACLGNEELCRILVDAGAKFDFRFGSIKTSDALFAAALSRNENLCKYFLEKNVDLNVRQMEQRTVLHELILRSEPMSYFTKRNVFELNRSPFRVFGPFKSVGDPVQMPHGTGEEDATSPRKPCETSVELCKLFLDAGANPDLRDASGTSPLETVFVTQMKKMRSFEEFQSLLDLFLDAKVDLNAKDRNGWTALNYYVFYSFMAPPPKEKKGAIEDGEDEEEDADEDENEEDEDGFFEENGPVTPPIPIPRNSSGKNHDTDVSYGPTLEQRIAIFQKLLDAGADIKTVDNKGNTVLHFAAAAPEKKVDKCGITVDLSYETRGSNRDYCRKLIELMVEKGCSISTKNKDGETPLDWAMQGGPSRGGYGGMSGGMGGGMLEVQPSASPVDLMMRQ